ncbi:hypothetical protein [Listeria costaricensis]|uniref:hypothetical protein n=1 Tax=Listeria costaricensis TaxID=2026604 RepID=UPI000C07DE71|nr:hypothetical protein [Listeria costaricensis]
MTTFFKYLLTIILALIALNILFDLIGVTLHFLFPLLILALIVYLIMRIWNKPAKDHRYSKSGRDHYDW